MIPRTITFVRSVFAYIAAWVIIPEEGEKVSIAEKFINKGNG